MKRVVKLNRIYDVDRLRADFEAARRMSRRLDGEHENRGDYHDGGWSAIPLVAPGGRTDAAALRWGGKHARYLPTPILEACPYFCQIVKSFGCPKERVRLLRLAPGAVIHEHRDDGDGWAVGKVRLHVPIFTSEKIDFVVAGQRVIMRPGQLWYCDFTRPHSVANRSDIDRIHLVLDLVINRWLRGLFPPESPAERLETALLRTRYEARARARELAHHMGLGTVRRTLRTITANRPAITRSPAAHPTPPPAHAPTPQPHKERAHV